MEFRKLISSDLGSLLELYKQLDTDDIRIGYAWYAFRMHTYMEVGLCRIG